jgi:hypothetical protein
MNIHEELMGLVDCLNKADLPYAICGGLAVTLHGYTRLTDDLDLLVPAAYVPLVKQAARQCGFTVAPSAPMIFRRGTSHETAVHRVSKFRGEDSLILDLIEVGVANRDAWKSRRAYRWEGRRLWAITRKSLLAMKRAAGRPQDLLDVEALEGRLES